MGRVDVEPHQSGLGLFVDLKVRVDDNLMVRQADEIAEEVARKLKSSRFSIVSCVFS